MPNNHFLDFQMVIIGSGNLAWHIAFALKSAGVSVLQVFSRNLHHAEILASKLDCDFTNEPSLILDNAYFYLFAISDNAIESFAKNPVFFNKNLVHTSGTIPSTVFSNVTNSYGVFYPLQTFTRNKKVDFSNIPICIHSNDPVLKKRLNILGSLLSTKVTELDDTKRKTLHLAAVFTNNFVNHMLVIASDLLDNQSIDTELLLPLMEETVAKAKCISALKAQTGPALRNDTVVMKKHLKMLEHYPEYEKIYTFVSESIRVRHLKNT